MVGADATVESSIVRRTRAVPVFGFGDGLLVGALPNAGQLESGTLTVLDSVVEERARAGLSNFVADATLTSGWFDCNPIDLDLEPDPQHPGGFQDNGGNRCGCAQAEWACRVLSANLDPPGSL